MKQYDYVIVGAGSAGCVLTNKLSASGEHSVLVLEAGPMDHNLFIHIPAGVYNIYRNPKYDWGYATEQEKTLNKRQIVYPRGKVIGGSSSTNSMVYMRGHPLDYDGWAQNHGLTEWRYADCLPYFKAGENSDRGETDYRGGSGPLGVTSAKLENPLYDALIGSGKITGQGYSEDLNGYNPEGVARFDSTTKKGRRCSAARAFLKPALKRKNVTLITKAMVQKVIIENNRAVGIDFIHKGVRQRVEANKEVILSGGAINSPQLLMLSGIGPADHLKEHGIDVVLDHKGVGSNLLDHANVTVNYACTKPITLDKLAKPMSKAAIGMRWFMDRGGIGASNIWEAGGLIRGNDTVAYPNHEYHFAPFGVRYEGDKMILDQSFSLQIDLSRPTSRGTVRLKSNNPQDKAAIELNYMDTEEDCTQMIEGIQKARELIAQSPFDAFRGKEMTPGAENITKDTLYEKVKQDVETDYHPCSTCRMGHDDMAVVDDRMRVKGIDGLRVVDASIMPEITSANLNAPTQMIAARAADYILGNAQLTPIEAKFKYMEA